MWFGTCLRLQAALSGAEAARRELEAAHSASGSEARATAARAAEAAARAATLQRQLETERAQVAAAVASHQEEVAALKVGHDTCQHVLKGVHGVEDWANRTHTARMSRRTVRWLDMLVVFKSCVTKMNSASVTGHAAGSHRRLWPRRKESAPGC